MPKIEFSVGGMVCTSCEQIVERSLKKTSGVKKAKANYKDGILTVDYDGRKIKKSQIVDIVSDAGYTLGTKESRPDNRMVLKVSDIKRGAFSLLLIVLAFSAYYKFAPLIESYMPAFGQDASLGLLFIIGFFTGFHCIAMCGGFVIGYSTQEKGMWPHMVYGGAKTLSYAVIGAGFGLLGSFIAFTPALRGGAAVLAGIFLILFGLNMLNLLSWARSLSIGTPSFTHKLTQKHGKSPLMIGLLNGFMLACGPLQAIYLMAAASGSPLMGASYLFAFGLGTLPVLLGFGIFTQIISRQHTATIIRYSGVLVIVLGMVMVNRGMSLAGTGYDVNTLIQSASAQDIVDETPQIEVTEDGFQTIKMTVTRYGWSPDKFVLKKDVPVKWEINGKEITGCNNAIQVPAFDLEFPVKRGQQTIEFTPDREGVIPWSCWMGMIPGTFIVKDDIDIQDPVQIEKAIEEAPAPAATGGSCGGSCGGGSGCGCGCGGG